MSKKKVHVYDEKNGKDHGVLYYDEDAIYLIDDKDVKTNRGTGLKVRKILNTTSFFMKLFDDESVREKLKFMNPGEVLFDDERNEESDTYYDIMDNMKPGQSVRITVELLEEDEKC